MKIDYFSKLNNILFHIAENYETSFLGTKIDIDSLTNKDFNSQSEVHHFIREATGLGLIKSSGSFVYTLTYDGWRKLQDLDNAKLKTDQAFVAMWFDEEVNEVWENGIFKALYDLGYNPLRIDKKEHNEKIDDHIIAEIRKSGLLIADFTGNRNGVYFEAGFAMGLGIPVIWTCNKDDIDNVHFDTRQYNHIVWETPEELKEKLTNRIEATILNRPIPRS